MSIFDNNNIVEITKEDINQAANSCVLIDEKDKNRAFANVLGANLGIKLLNINGIKGSNLESLYSIPAVLKDIDMSDININNLKIDVRIVADENHLCIPKAQYTYELTPDIYIFLKIDKEFSTAQFIGAIAPDEIDKSVESNGYYFINSNNLYNITSLKNAIEKGKPQSNIEITDDDIVKAEAFLVNFIDGYLDNKDRKFVYEILKRSSKFRSFVKDFEHFELISTNLAHTEELLNDSVLDVIGAQQIYKDETYEENVMDYINLDEIANETVADFVEDFIDENKDMDMIEKDNNNTIDENFNEVSEDILYAEPHSLEDLQSEDELTESLDFSEMVEPNSLEELPSDEELANLSSNIDDNFNNFEELPELSNDNIDINDDINQELNITNPELDMFEEIPPLEIISAEDENDLLTNMIDEENINENNEITTNIEPTSLLDAVQNEGMELTPEESLKSLEAEEMPIDMTLPTLEFDDNLPSLDEDVIDTQNDISIDTINNEENNEDISFVMEDDNKESDDNISNFNLDEDNTSEINFSDFEINSEAEELTEVEPDVETNLEETTKNNDDFSGFEEFTMDMASEVERTNPDLLKPQGPIQKYDAMQGFSQEANDFNSDENNGFYTEEIASATPQEETNSLFDESLDINNEYSDLSQNESQEIDENTNIDDLDMAFEGFTNHKEAEDENSVNNTSDDLKDYIEDELIDEDNDFMDNDDFNIDEIDINDIDLNDPNLNIENIDLDMDLNDTEDFNYVNNDNEESYVSSLENIPDVSAESTNYMNMQPDNEFMQAQSPINMEQEQSNQYIPDFNSNDLGTIETLYDGNSDMNTQMQNDAMNQSFNANINNAQNQNQNHRKKQKTSPLLPILFLVLLGALGYYKKDFILEKLNENNLIPMKQQQTQEQKQNMPIEGEDNQDTEMQADTNISDINDEDKKGIGAIPGESDNAQNAKKKDSSIAEIEPQTIKSPEPLSSKNIKRIYWEAPEELTYNASVVNFLKTVGRTIKYEAQSRLLSAHELPYSTKMTVDVVIKKDGTFDDMSINSSSGSKQIDDIVLQSVKAALKYVKAPTAEFKDDSYNFSLIINF